MKLSTVKKIEKLNYDIFFRSGKKEGGTGLYLLSAFFIPKNI